ncbi:DNA adenine methylase [Kangiella marina]|uniref:Site-specific DNA-methyltransferase (adenine-specific) n=2 Tax=Kangiella marina TaxID=1079178 RepID=A0ABP8IFU9_9GAMM
MQVLWKLSEKKRLVEPFSGGMAISLGISPDKALINDINKHVINFYRCVKNDLRINIKMINDEAYYYKARERFNNLIKREEENTELAASLFYYLNRTGYNGLIRFNRSGLYNVPFGRYKKINYRREFSDIQSVIKDWNFSSKDYSKVRINKSDFVYIDPPYDVQFTSYSGNEFGWKEQERVVNHFDKYDCPLVISNQATERVVELYKDYGYKVFLIDAPRMISCDGNRTRAQEVLAIRNMSIKRIG